MFGFGACKDLKKTKKRFMGFAAALENDKIFKEASRHESIINAAIQLRDMLRYESLDLAKSEKIRIVRSITKAKVRAFKEGTQSSYNTFKTLDSISNELVGLL